MATLLLSAAGAAVGGSFGGSFAGLSAGVLGKAAGASLGAVIDRRISGLGSEPVETGRVERFRIMGSSEGAPLPRVFGRMRVSGQIIWSSRFLESFNRSRVGGKGGGGGGQEVREYSYSISLAVALCEGEVTRVGRIWADGQRMDLAGVTWRLHAGGEDQLPDPLIAAVEGADQAPAYRGTAYVVFENLRLGPFGNRIPQLSFEVFRRSPPLGSAETQPALGLQGVALVPGTGEYSLATRTVHLSRRRGQTVAANVNNDRNEPDLLVSLDQLEAELPNVSSVSLVVSWFGDDLRCGRCRLRPMVEQKEADGRQMPWVVSNLDRWDAEMVARVDDRPLFGGTPADAAVLEAISAMRESGRSVMFYPFILMDILPGNILEDPWTGGVGQPRVPWRGRITLSRAPGLAGSPDKTSAAAAEVAAFFGQAQPNDFSISGDRVVYSGPPEWSYRRFILHYAHLCALSGGVDAFCIGSEMRSLTQLRDGETSYPAVQALCALAAEARAILGPHVRIGYAADWSEYFGHRPDDGSGDVLFHLDPLWSHSSIDFVGIDNYMPVSDWRDTIEHLDATEARSIYDLEYLKRNVAGGEGYEWYYASAEARIAQQRTPIQDTAYGEDWVFRYKDIRNWWSNHHHDRIGGVRSSVATSWVPESKPFWFTEFGCPAVDKGTNQPNVFLDPKSSESFFPHFSDGVRDDFIQRRYIEATLAHWGAPENNPVSRRYAGRMVDLARAHAWAWDARPWPDFPDRLETWIDGDNFERGHWLNARLGTPSLAEVVAEICGRAEVSEIDVVALDGGVTGYLVSAIESARQSLQPLMLSYAFDSFSSLGRVAFSSRGSRISTTLSSDALVAKSTGQTKVSTRSARAEAPKRVVLSYVSADDDYQAACVQAISPEDSESDVSQSDLPIAFTGAQGLAIAERWLSEGVVTQDTVEFTLPPSSLEVTAGDLVRLEGTAAISIVRIDRIEETVERNVTAVRVDPAIYRAPLSAFKSIRRAPPRAATPVHFEFLDLPLLEGDEIPHAAHLAVVKLPWDGPVAVYSSRNESEYRLNREILAPAVIGTTLDSIGKATPGILMRSSMRVRLDCGFISSRSLIDVLSGANAAAIRSPGSTYWEVIQFLSATRIGSDDYLIAGLLRGQAGTDSVAPDSWPAGSDFCLLDAALIQLDLPAATRGIEMHYRIGPSSRSLDDPTFLSVRATCEGVGLRPYSPVHLRAQLLLGRGLHVTWIRRTRIDGDSWSGLDVPVGEVDELYRVTLRNDGTALAVLDVTKPEVVIPDAIVTAVQVGAVLEVSVAQVSMTYGPGPEAHVAVQR